MRKVFAMTMAILMLVLCLAGCGKKEQTATTTADGAQQGSTADTNTDSAYVKSNGKLVIGITEFAPMDFQKEGSTEWVGFDADLAKAFAAELGVEAEFVVINWDNKEFELNSKSIDCRC